MDRKHLFRLARFLLVIVLYPFNAKKLRNWLCRHCFSFLQELIMKYFLNRIYNKEGLAIFWNKINVYSSSLCYPRLFILSVSSSLSLTYGGETFSFYHFVSLKRYSYKFVHHATK